MPSRQGGASLARELYRMETDRVQTSWGTSWLLLGLLTCAGTAAATRRDDLLLLILAFYLVSILLVGVVC